MLKKKGEKASKCETHTYFPMQTLYDEFSLVFKKESGFTYYYKLLKNKYADTEFYSEVIRECSWFREYLK